MQVSDIKPGHTYQGKAADSDKTRLVVAIDERRKEALTETYRGGTICGASIISLRTLAQWAAADVTAEVARG